jgi:hypothetical protein
MATGSGRAIMADYWDTIVWEQTDGLEEFETAYYGEQTREQYEAQLAEGAAQVARDAEQTHEYMNGVRAEAGVA